MQLGLKMVGMSVRCWRVTGGAWLAAQLLLAQSPKPDPDVLLLVDGERLVGQFEQSNGASVKFKSDLVGEVTVDWSKVKELHTSAKFAVIPKNVELRKNSDTSKIPQGTIAAVDQKITVTPATGAPQTVNAADADHVVEETAFDNAVHRNPNFFSDWGGAVTIGATLVQATQESKNFNGIVTLVRTDPDEDWLRRRNRTLVNLSMTYGTLEQPNTPTVKTNIYHGGLERDEYFSNSIFGFAQVSYDHNFSQGLKLQQSYGGGIGWSAIKRANESLDLKAGLTFVRQSFAEGAQNQSLAGSTFEEDFQRGLWRGMKLTQQLIIAPAWTNTSALTASGNALLTVPVYKRMNFSFGTIDNYLNNPPPGFKKNSVQLTMGLTYALR
jgi:hypothetical protein